MQITSANTAARCPLCHHTGFQKVRDKHPSLTALMMCTACGTETEYSALVAQLAHFRTYGRESAHAER